MKIKFKKSLLLAFVSAGLVAGAVGAAGVSPVKASAAGVSTDIVMKTGASLYLDEISGLKFSYTVSNYDADKNYGMLIVPFDYLDEAGITDLTLAENDYVPALMQAKADGAIAYEPIVIENLTPNAENVIEYSIGDIQETNYVRQFFGIGFIKSGDTYTYATQDDNVRSVFEVANRAVNKLNFGEWDMENEKEVKEKELLQNNEENVLNPFINKGIEFVYGAGTTLDISLATYVNGNVNPTITTAKEKDVAFDVQWNYNSANLTRGENQTVTASVGTAFNATTNSAVVLKDKGEYLAYNNSHDTDFFSNNDGSLLLTNGGHISNSSSQFDVDASYVALMNPNSEDGKYTLDEKGTYVDFYFTNNNMPNVEFFGQKLATLKSGNTNSTIGYLVSNGFSRKDMPISWNMVKEYGGAYCSDYANYPTVYVSANNYKYGCIDTYPTMFRYGVYAYGGSTASAYNYASASNKFKATHSAYSRQIVYKSSSGLGFNTVKDSSDFSMYALLENSYDLANKQDVEQKWHYVVGMYLNGSDVYLDAKLYKVDANGNDVDNNVETEELDAFATCNIKVETLAEGVTRSGYILAHAAIKGASGKYTTTNRAGTITAEEVQTTFSCSTPYSK